MPGRNVKKPSFLNPIVTVGALDRELPIIGRSGELTGPDAASTETSPSSNSGEAKTTPTKEAKEKPKGLLPKESHKSINPLGMRIVAKIRPEADHTDSGLYLPEGSKSEHAESILAEVVEVASAIDEDTNEETNISGIPMGALILVDSDAGVTVPWDDSLRIIETAEVLALVDELTLL